MALARAVRRAVCSAGAAQQQTGDAHACVLKDETMASSKGIILSKRGWG